VDETEHDETEHNDELEHQDQQAMPPAINNPEQPDNSNNEHQQNGMA
jgi:hypothetical protein